MPARRTLLRAAVLVAGAVLFTGLCRRYDVVQDDAYISLVYARNLVHGDGLVFNPGERVEGYTNFLWVLVMALPHVADVDAVACARGLGYAAALALLWASWRLAASLSTRPGEPALLAAPVWLAANGALAFWAVSGLETTAFALAVCLGATRYLRRGRLDAGTGLLFGLAALTRPEGWMFFGLTALHRGVGILTGEGPALPEPRGATGAASGGGWSLARLRRDVGGALAFALLTLPHLAFRLAYYGYPLPNTFYAKTGVSLTYLAHGLRYLAGFLVDYGLWGLGPVLALAVLWRRRTRWASSYAALLLTANLLYVILVGGDTMAENRLFLPVLGLLAALQAEALRVGALLVLGRRRAPAGVLLVALAVAGRWVAGPDADLRHARDATRAHNDKLEEWADYLLEAGPQRYPLVATTAIGIPRYRTGSAVLDMVGLTDQTVAHHPVRLPGVADDHILRNYNVAYVMDRAPQAILFITGVRPGTPAERALFLSRRFRRGYVLTFLRDDRPLFVRRAGADRVHPDLYADGAFVELYADALAIVRRDPDRALNLLTECVALGPGDFALPHYWIGRIHLEAGRLEAAEEHLRRALDIDPATAMAWSHLAVVDLARQRPGEALAHARRAVELAPRSHFNRYIHGRALLASGRASAAAEELALAVRLGGSHAADALYWLGCAFRAQGDGEAARQAWTSLLEQVPRHAAARAALSRLGRNAGPSQVVRPTSGS